MEPETIRLIAREEAEKILMTHINLCPFSKADVEKRMRGIENRFGILIGFMAGSGMLGGISGALFTKLLG